MKNLMVFESEAEANESMDKYFGLNRNNRRTLEDKVKEKSADFLSKTGLSFEQVEKASPAVHAALRHELRGIGEGREFFCPTVLYSIAGRYQFIDTLNGFSDDATVSRTYGNIKDLADAVKSKRNDRERQMMGASVAQILYTASDDSTMKAAYRSIMVKGAEKLPEEKREQLGQKIYSDPLIGLRGLTREEAAKFMTFYNGFHQHVTEVDESFGTLTYEPRIKVRQANRVRIVLDEPEVSGTAVFSDDDIEIVVNDAFPEEVGKQEGSRTDEEKSPHTYSITREQRVIKDDLR